MKAAEFKTAYEVAVGNEDLSQVEIGHMFGFGRKSFKPVCVTIRQVAALIRCQCQYMNGRWDMEELTDIKNIGRKKFMVIG